MRPGARGSARIPFGYVPRQPRTGLTGGASILHMKRMAKQGLLLTAITIAVTAVPMSHAEAGAMHRPRSGAERSVTRTESRTHARSAHHRGRFARSARALTALTACTRTASGSGPLPGPARRHRPHRATVPRLTSGSHRPRTLRSGSLLATVPARMARGPFAAHELRRGPEAAPGMWFDPIRSGRGPPRAGPLRSSPALVPPASGPCFSGALTLAPGRRSSRLSVPIRRIVFLRASPAPGSPSSLISPQFPRPASRRLIARRPEGAAERSIMPS